MKPILTPAEMAACDSAAIAAGMPGEILMDRAAAAVASTAARMAGGAYGRRFEILCGTGNNGGDGIAAARHLVAAGASVRLLLIDDPGTLRGSPALHWARLRGLGIPWSRGARSGPVDVVVDAMVGTGLSGPLRPDVAALAERINELSCPVLAVDIPSGVEGATGAVHGKAVRATHTVTFAALKVGLVYGEGPEHTGSVEVADIGIETPLEGASWAALDDVDVDAWLPTRSRTTHKWTAGSVLVVAGSPGMAGAGILTASTALRSGAGIVVLAVPAEVLPTIESHPDLTEVMTAPHDEVPSMLDRFGAVAIGPGLGTTERARSLVAATMKAATVPVVIDADGLNLATPDLLAGRPGPTVLTPHAGEWRRLAGEPQGGPLDDVTARADEWRVTVVHKGATTIVASHEGHRLLTLTGHPDLATAGSGDVLTGLTASLLAQGLEAWRAAALGAHIHGWAGEGARRATDVRDGIAAVIGRRGAMIGA